MARRKPKLAPCAAMAGLGALSKGDKNKLNLDNLVIDESVNIDACYKVSEPNANRWDYFIGIQRRGELYVEIHEVSEAHFQKLLDKASWLREKISKCGWPLTPGRTLFVAPTRGISPFELYGVLSKRLAVHKITVVRKDDLIVEML